MADIFDVIADATRRELLQHLLDASLRGEGVAGELSVSELVDRMDATQPTVSKHLKVLRDHGLVTVRDEGQHRYYTVDSAPLEEVEDWIIPFLSADFDPDNDGSPVFAAWAGANVAGAGSSVGRVAADASHQARTIIEGAQEKLHDVQEAVSKRLPWKNQD
ncbi:metalloregulator ArsR/SmtB family transcription factor [Microcella sp.]|uniref:ArsR/SmtB family transcription factor n=1 Tax=Microcella sp. TaxID=1913979 RepID=UPI00299F7B37|nr:metalloregulator ArsR/SmtB family transcription factor [Microcella sp.]MDX2026509.1 metalloregulator ArsR/SmtB family transcription factor [Microcella sp.]